MELAKFSRIKKDFLEAMRGAGQTKTQAYDTPATVLRTDGDTLWVHIDGGVDETPIKRTIDARPGDVIQVRVGGGTAWATGNQTAPPTDDTKAKAVEAKTTVIEKVVNTVKTVAEKAYKIAGNTDQFFWVTETGTDTGAHITEIPREDFLADPDNGGGNLLARSNGMAVRDGMAELATFSSSGLNVTTYDGQGNGVDIAHLGYGLGNSGSGTEVKPYYTLGERRANSTIGNYSVAEGLDVVASGKTSHASGNSAEATGFASHAFGNHVSASVEGQMVIGRYNASSTYPFVVGNGSQAMGNSNAFTVDWDGYAWHKHDGVYDARNVIINGGPASVASAQMRIWGNVAQLYLELNGAVSIGAGDDVFTGTLYDQYDIVKLPAQYVTGVGYYGAMAIVGRINTSGGIVIRNASNSAISSLSSGVSLSFTYIFENH